jgi:hypothetical protein
MDLEGVTRVFPDPFSEKLKSDAELGFKFE